MTVVNSLLCLCLLAPVNVQQHANGGCLLHAWRLPGNRTSHVWFLHKFVCLIKLMWARLPYFNLPVSLRLAMWYFVDTGLQHGRAQTIKVHLPLSGLVFHMWAFFFCFLLSWERCVPAWLLTKEPMNGNAKERSVVPAGGFLVFHFFFLCHMT